MSRFLGLACGIMSAMPDVIPMLSYRNGVAALDWLARAFGFSARNRMLDSEGRLSHGELHTGDGVIMIATPTPEYEGPRLHAQNCERTRSWTAAVPWVIDGVLVHVDDLDSHYTRAVEAGAVILTPPEDGPPGRRYRAEDLEGHRWMFIQRAR